jgi:hypothetical protein
MSESFNSAEYWERRYAGGANSGAGSYGVLANYKASYINKFASDHGVLTSIELGCGDGNQASLFRLRSYTGTDVSESALVQARKAVGPRRGWSFVLDDGKTSLGEPRDLALSLDVIYHLVEDEVYDRYMRTLFDMSSRWVLIYASDWEGASIAPHVRHRWHSAWVAKHRTDWSLVERAQNPYPFRADDDLNTTFASFAVFEKRS